MHGRTHVLGGLAAAGAAVALGAPHPLTLAAAAAFGSLLPDWDHPHSTLGRCLPWPAVAAPQGPGRPPRLGRMGPRGPIWHRHQAHSVLGCAVASGIATGLAALAAHALHHPLRFPGTVAAGLFLGCLSHLFLDAFNETPQWWGWPFTRRGFRWPLHAPVAVADGIASAFLLLACLALGWHALPHLAAPTPGWRR